jgi:hypothetical protein
MNITSTLISNAIANQIQNSPDLAGSQIYFERIKQNFKRPCFFVIQQSLENEKSLQFDYFRTYIFTISWFPELNETFFREKCEETGEILTGLFRILTITDDNKTTYAWVRNLVCEIVDDHLAVTFEIRIKTTWDDSPKPDKMEVLETLTQHFREINVN